MAEEPGIRIDDELPSLTVKGRFTVPPAAPKALPPMVRVIVPAFPVPDALIKDGPDELNVTLVHVPEQERPLMAAANAESGTVGSVVGACVVAAGVVTVGAAVETVVVWSDPLLFPPPQETTRTAATRDAAANRHEYTAPPPTLRGKLGKILAPVERPVGNPSFRLAPLGQRGSIENTGMIRVVRS
jgi:hypothetical protein